MKKIKQNNQKGITLIALVITIIVLLILAGASIQMLAKGDESILGKAEKAVKKNEEAAVLEKANLLLEDTKLELYEEGVKQENPGYLRQMGKKLANRDEVKEVIGITRDQATLTNKYQWQNKNGNSVPDADNLVITKLIVTLTNENSFEIGGSDNGSQTGSPAGTQTGTKQSFAITTINNKPVGSTTTTGNTTPGTPQNPGGTITEEQTVVGKIVEGTNMTYTDKNGKTAIIPVGYAIVTGCESIAGGLVISDAANDTADTGNQFVWIPVSKENFETEFVRRNATGYEEVDGKGNVKYYKKEIYNDACQPTGTYEQIPYDDVDEAREMYASVKTNGGFYIGRYEAGVESTTERQQGLAPWNVPAVVKKDKFVYNLIGWNGSSDKVYGRSMGAVERAKNFIGSNNANVRSTLCYGVQWDAALKFIETTDSAYLSNSTGKGNYSGSLAKTGSNEAYQVNNIYDMAGNVFEWTMEIYSESSRVVRGGCWRWSSFGTSASYRSYGQRDIVYDYYGFRIALYLVNE